MYVFSNAWTEAPFKPWVCLSDTHHQRESLPIRGRAPPHYEIPLSGARGEPAPVPLQVRFRDVFCDCPLGVFPCADVLLCVCVVCLSVCACLCVCAPICACLCVLLCVYVCLFGVCSCMRLCPSMFSCVCVGLCFWMCLLVCSVVCLHLRGSSI
jgi:hypothetical protein